MTVLFDTLFCYMIDRVYIYNIYIFNLNVYLFIYRLIFLGFNLRAVSHSMSAEI